MQETLKASETSATEDDKKYSPGLNTTGDNYESPEEIFYVSIVKNLLDKISSLSLLPIRKPASEKHENDPMFMNPEDILCGCFLRELLEQAEKSATIIQLSTDSKTLITKYTEFPDIQVEPEFANSTNWIEAAFEPLEAAYQLKECLGSGTFGEVRKVVKRDTFEELAAKFVKASEVGDREIEIWSILKHPNILPLLETVTNQGAQIFISPLLKADLHDIVSCHHYKFDQVHKYLKDGLKGLNYLHSIGVCHLDMKADNILVGESGACVCDFGFATYSNTSITNNDVGMPNIFRPPEACALRGREAIIPDGQSVDIWGYGIMLVELLALFPLTSQVKGEGDWHKYVHPVLFNVLQKKEFKKKVSNNFKELDNEKIVSALDLIHRMLRKTPQKRMSTKDALCHPFFKDGKLKTLRKHPRDYMWKSNQSPLAKITDYFPRQLAKMRAKI